MKAALTKMTKTGTKTIYGDILQRGLGAITLAVTENNGSKSIKRFKEADYTVHCYE
jgi:hypothetical protein